MDWKGLPITKAALEGEPGEPPAIQKEWARVATEDQNVLFLWTGSWHRRNSYWGWVWFSHRVGEESRGEPHPVTRVPAANVERMLSPLAHEARVRIMQAMYDEPKSAAALTEATGLRGGNFYYHLRELLHAAYVKEANGGYDLTPLGCQMLLTITAIADKVITDAGERGLLVAPAPGGE